MDKNERFMTLIGRTIGRKIICVGVDYMVGKEDEVEFDFNKTWKRFEEGNFKGFYHTHPFSVKPHPSDIDIKTMKAWIVATGKPLICAIEGKNSIMNTWIVLPDYSSKVTKIKWIKLRAKKFGKYFVFIF